MASSQTIVLIRHGEKPKEGGAPHGVNQHGEHDAHSLSVRGWTRAGALAAMFAHLPHPANPALVAPQRIYATRPSHSAKSTRELDTAKPTALRLGLDVDDSIEHGDEGALANQLRAHALDALVVWHHGKLVRLVHLFPLANPEHVPEHWPDHRFDLYWILRSDTDGPGGRVFTFTALPQRLLDGDTDI